MGKNPIKTKRKAARRASKEAKKNRFQGFWAVPKEEQNKKRTSRNPRKKKPRIRLMSPP